MKEFIEKLIGRLEAQKTQHLDSENAARELGEDYSSLADFFMTNAIAFNQAISIVKKLAEEYSHCTLCYLQSLCEYQSVDIRVDDSSGWIPCSERLPKNLEHIYITGSLKEKSLYEDVLGETKSTDCFYGYYRDSKFYGYTEEGVFWLLDAKAWQPLSEPYKHPDGYWEEFQFLSSTWMRGSKYTPEERR